MVVLSHHRKDVMYHTMYNRKRIEAHRKDVGKHWYEIPIHACMCVLYVVLYARCQLAMHWVSAGRAVKSVRVPTS